MNNQLINKSSYSTAISLKSGISLLFLLVGLAYSCKSLKKSITKPEVNDKVTAESDVKTDTVRKSEKLKSYKEVITDKAITKTGLITIHQIEKTYYFEIPDSLFGRDLLVVNRIKSGAAGGRVQGFGYAGDEYGESVMQFTKGPDHKVFLKKISFLEQSNDSTANGLYRSVLNSNIQPIIAAFDAKTISLDGKNTVIDVTDYVNSDNDGLFFNNDFKKVLKLGAFQKDKSYVKSINTFPINIEITTVKTYQKTDAGFTTYELNNSIILLPKTPMQPRYADPRIGYFSADYVDYDWDPQRVEQTSMITRWRLEPKDEDIAKYQRGELVEPKKPIVFYIDPTTPKKWIPYLIQGIDAWQKAFEKAGFKNAIYGLEAPKNDSTWSIDDATHNVLVYKPSDISNARGLHVHDPRSGEIIESHINWYHNVMALVHDWYMVQAGPSDPNARKMEFDERLMGQLIQMVCTHEIGHALGLMHNFGASSTVPVDSLRSKKGFARAFYCDLDGKEHTLWFNGICDVMISVYSFFTQQPASENIELLEDSILQSITWQELQDVYTDHPSFNYHGRKLTETYYIRSEERAMMLHCKKPIDRYRLLLKTYPNILQQASLKQIASYLGIELETLSRLRANKSI